MIERLYIQDIQIELHYKDRRSVRRWCRNNNVQILSDIGSNKQYVLRDEYEKAKSKNYCKGVGVINSTINFLSKKYNIMTQKVNIYKPKGENEKLFLSILQNI